MNAQEWLYINEQFDTLASMELDMIANDDYDDAGLIGNARVELEKMGFTQDEIQQEIEKRWASPKMLLKELNTAYDTARAGNRLPALEVVIEKWDKRLNGGVE